VRLRRHGQICRRHPPRTAGWCSAHRCCCTRCPGPDPSASLRASRRRGGPCSRTRLAAGVAQEHSTHCSGPRHGRGDSEGVTVEHALRQYQLAEPSRIQAVLHLAGARGSTTRLVVLASKVPGALAKRWTSVMAPGSAGEMWPELPGLCEAAQAESNDLATQQAVCGAGKGLCDDATIRLMTLARASSCRCCTTSGNVQTVPAWIARRMPPLVSLVWRSPAEANHRASPR